MANLEQLLLEAAGRRVTTGKNAYSSPPHRRRLTVSSSNGYCAQLGGKPSGLRTTMKRNMAVTKRAVDQECGNEESDSDSFGNDLYKDEDDREILSKLSELEREMILEARATERSDRVFTKTLKKRKVQHGNGSPPTRRSRSKTERAGALVELVKRRRDAARKRSSKVNLHAANVSNSSLSLSNEVESSGDEMMSSSDEDNDWSEVPTFDEIKKITIPRSKLAKWHIEPFFNELISGCFVRVLIGKGKSEVPVYRLCEVLNVDATDPNRAYEFENRTTYKYLNLVWGNGSPPARWQMAVVSNSPPLKVEFDQWVREVKLNGGHMPTEQEVLEKKEAIQKISSFVYSAAAVKQMLEEKRSAGWKPSNIAAEKVRLRRKLEMMKDDEADQVDRIKKRLQELEATRQGSEVGEKAIVVEELNKRNWIENMKSASKKKTVETDFKSSGEDYDPFSRRWTRSRNYYMGSSSREAAGKQEINVDPTATPVDNDVGDRVSAETKAAAASQGKLVDTTAPLDQESAPNVLHKFEISVSLDVIEKFGGPRGSRAGLLARKQKIEAVFGTKVAEDDGGSHEFTLTVTEYRKRRGLT